LYYYSCIGGPTSCDAEEEVLIYGVNMGQMNFKSG